MMAAKRRPFGTVEPRAGYFRAVYQGPDGGKYVVLNEFGHTRKFPTEADGRRELVCIQADVYSGRWVSPKAPKAQEVKRETFADYAARYVSQANIKVRTEDSYDSLLRIHLLPAFGDSTLAEITPPVVAAWRDLRRDKRPIKARAYGLLSTIMNDAYRTQHPDVPFNPCLVKGGSEADTDKEAHLFSNEELGALKAELPEFYRAMVDLGCWGTLRIGEVMALQRKHLDLEAMTTIDGNRVFAPTVRVEAGRIYSKRNGGLADDDPKSDAGDRIVELPPFVIPRLQAHLDYWVKPDPDAQVFAPRQGGKFIGYSSMQRVWHPARVRAGIFGTGPKPTTFHDLRHTGNTRFDLAGATKADCSYRIGHKKDKRDMTAHYTHSTPENRRRAANAMREDY